MRNPIARFSCSIIVLVILCTSCNGDDACDDGFVQQYGPEGSTFCIPEFEEGLLNNFNLGDSYFHEEHGVIRLDKGVWKNQSNTVVLP